MPRNMTLSPDDEKLYGDMLEAARKSSGISDLSLPQLVRRAMRLLNEQEGYVEEYEDKKIQG